VKSLIITQFAPLPPHSAVDGVYQRLKMFVKALAEISEKIDFLGLVPKADFEKYREVDLSELLSQHWQTRVFVSLTPTRQRKETHWSYYGAGILSASQQSGFYHFTGPEQIEAIRLALNAKPDVVFVFRLGAMLAVLEAGVRPARVFFDLDDVEHIAQARRAAEHRGLLQRLKLISQVPALIAAEHRAAKLSKATFVCSEKDVSNLRKLGFGSKVMLIPNSVPIPKNVRCCPRGKSLLYIGSFRYKPNRDGANRLIKRIWPLIKLKHPDATLIIAGKDPQQLESFSGNVEGVEFAGFVEDLAELYSRIRLVVCPITVGAGTRIKLIEAASYAKPIVSTRIGAEGLDFKDGTEIMLRDEDQSFADACSTILSDDDLSDRMSEAVRLASFRYDSDDVRHKLVKVILNG
jgi:glycosyltransferase involved in cell wall biosynthesis